MSTAINHYRRLLSLLPDPPADVGTVTGITAGGVTLELLNGSKSTARGVAAIGTLVYIRDGVVQGPAPDLDTSEIEV
jgi:hypothetical protein